MSNDRIQAFLERNKDKLTNSIRPKYAPTINTGSVSSITSKSKDMKQIASSSENLSDFKPRMKSPMINKIENIAVFKFEEEVKQSSKTSAHMQTRGSLEKTEYSTPILEKSKKETLK